MPIKCRLMAAAEHYKLTTLGETCFVVLGGRCFLRTTIPVFSLEFKACPYLCVCKMPCCGVFNVHLILLSQSISIMQPCIMKEALCSCWFLSLHTSVESDYPCSCQNECSDQNYSPFECHGYIYLAQDTLCVSVCPLWEWGLECHQREPKLGQAQMDWLLSGRAAMLEAVIVLHKEVLVPQQAQLNGGYQRLDWSVLNRTNQIGPEQKKIY